MSMVIDVLVCHTDGTQTLEQREVPDDYFAAPEPQGPDGGAEAQN